MPVARPSLLLITLDTTRADHLGCYGREGAATPNLDALARAGVLFDNALSPAPLTLVSHATMMTGLAPRRHGVRDNVAFRLDPSRPTLASVLQSQGYATAAAVASAVLDRNTGIARGFATYDDRVRIGPRSAFNFEERAASQVTLAASELLAGLEPPFFLWVHYYDPHHPYVPPQPYAGRFAGNPYDGEIAFVDEAIGRLLDALRARKLESSTVVAVAGDHGESLGEHGEARHDLFVYQATQRVPLLLKGPGITAGRRVGRNVGLVDLLPSLLDVLGLPPAKDVDGVSLVPLFTHDGDPDERAYEMESFFPAYSYGWAPPLALVRGRWKYIATPRPELYDLVADPAESRNLLADPSVGSAAAGEETARRLAAELRARHAADPPAQAFGAESAADDAERRARLASLGYVGGTVAPGQSLPPGPRLDPKDGAAIVRDLDRGNALIQDGRNAEAVRLLEPLAAQDPRNFPLLAALGAAQLGAGAFDRAIETHRRAAALRADYGLAHSNLAGALRASAAAVDGASPGAAGPRLGDPRAAALRDEAALEFEQALHLNPRDAESYLHGAELELERSRPEAARAILDRADRADAGDPELYLLAGRVEAALGESKHARAAFEKALVLDAGAGAVHAALGQLDYAAGDAHAAEAHYARALELTPSAEIAKTLGAVRLYALSDRPGALAAFRRALQLARDASDAREIADAIRELEGER